MDFKLCKANVISLNSSFRLIVPLAHQTRLTLGFFFHSNVRDMLKVNFGKCQGQI